MRSFTFLVPVLTGALVLACSGATTTDLFQGGTGPSPGGDDHGDGGHANGHDDASSGAEPDASHEGEDAGGGGGQGDATVDVVVQVDSAPPVDANPPPPKGLRCTDDNGHDTYCKTNETCCITSNGAAKCNAQLTFCSGTEIDCAEGADCKTGEVCCGTLIGNHYQSVRCQTSCGGMNNGYMFRFCNPTAAVDECASDGTTCTESQTLSGYYICN